MMGVVGLVVKGAFFYYSAKVAAESGAALLIKSLESKNQQVLEGADVTDAEELIDEAALELERINGRLEPFISEWTQEMGYVAYYSWCR